MYSTLLILHSIVRWLVLISLVYALYRSYKGWLSGSEFTKSDNTVRHITATVAHVQLLLGLLLYFVSPLMEYFFEHFKDAVHQRPIRFFGMEHSLMMLVAVVIITIGSASAKRKTDNKSKFKTMAIWFTIGLIIILIMIPWPFSPMASRPLFRI